MFSVWLKIIKVMQHYAAIISHFQITSQKKNLCTFPSVTQRGRCFRAALPGASDERWCQESHTIFFSLIKDPPFLKFSPRQSGKKILWGGRFGNVQLHAVPSVAPMGICCWNLCCSASPVTRRFRLWLMRLNCYIGQVILSLSSATVIARGPAHLHSENN